MYGRQVSLSLAVDGPKTNCEFMPCLYLNPSYSQNKITLATLPMIASNLPDEQEVCFSRFQSEQVSAKVIRHFLSNFTTTGHDRAIKT